MSISKLPENQRALLKALVAIDPRTAGDLAKDAGVSRPVIINAITGERGISGEALARLQKALHLTPSFQLDPDYAHVWRVGADVDPLVVAVDALVKQPIIWTPTKSIEDKDGDAYRGFFIISSCSKGEKVKPVAPYVVVDRDKYRLGRGNLVSVLPEEAKAITPKLFKDCEWANENRHQITFPAELSNIESLVNEGITVKATLSIIGENPTDWKAVEYIALKAGMSPDDVIKLISDVLLVQQQVKLAEK